MWHFGIRCFALIKNCSLPLNQRSLYRVPDSFRWSNHIGTNSSILVCHVSVHRYILVFHRGRRRKRRGRNGGGRGGRRKERKKEEAQKEGGSERKKCRSWGRGVPIVSCVRQGCGGGAWRYVYRRCAWWQRVACTRILGLTRSHENCFPFYMAGSDLERSAYLFTFGRIRNARFVLVWATHQSLL